MPIIIALHRNGKLYYINASRITQFIASPSGGSYVWISDFSSREFNETPDEIDQKIDAAIRNATWQ